MTARLLLDPGTGRSFAHFVLEPGGDDDVVSVVGSFNDWVPGVHVLARQDDGTRGVRAEVRHAGDVHFRYLGSGGRWFDDPTADRINEYGSTLLRDSAQPSGVIESKQTGKKKAEKRKKAGKSKAAKKADKKTGAKKSGKAGRKKA